MTKFISPAADIDLRLRAMECILAMLISRHLPKSAPAELEDNLTALLKAFQQKLGDTPQSKENFDLIWERMQKVLRMAADATVIFDVSAKKGG